MLTEENIRRGMTPDQAARAARIRLGAPASLKEQHRDVRGLPAADAVLQDLRFAFRLIRQGPLVLRRGRRRARARHRRERRRFHHRECRRFCGACRSRTSDRLYIAVVAEPLRPPLERVDAEFQDWRGRTRTLRRPRGLQRRRREHQRRSRAARAGAAAPGSRANALRRAPAAGAAWPRLHGRTTSGREPNPSSSSAMRVWKSRYARRPGGARDDDARERTRRHHRRRDARRHEVSGQHRHLEAVHCNRRAVAAERCGQLRVFGRLQDGAGRRDAQAELSGLGQQTIAAYPDATKDLVGVRLETFSERFIGGAGRPMIITVMAAVVFVLLIACANVANMLLSRSAARAREIAVRTAMGATRWRVVRQLLIESLVLGFMGGGIGLGLAVVRRAVLRGGDAVVRPAVLGRLRSGLRGRRLRRGRLHADRDRCSASRRRCTSRRRTTAWS